ncbi:MAG: hypothetical protein RIQ81_496 [Pseudomonadota bacterium]
MIHSSRSGMSMVAAIVALVLLSSEAFAIGSITSTGSLPRDTSRGFFDLSVVVKDVLPSDVALKPKESSLNQRLGLLLPDISASEALGTDPAGTAAVAFYLEFRDDAATETNANGNSDMTFYIRVIQVSANGLSNLIKQSSDQKTVKLRFKYYEDQTQKGDAVDGTVTVNPTVVNEAPENLRIIGSHRSLDVSFDRKTSIAFVGASDAASTGSPTDATVISFRLGASYPALPAKVFSPSSESDPASSCTFDESLASGGACITCPDKAYLDTAALALLDPENIKVKSASNGNRQINGLENDVSYAVVAMYQPDALKRSLCLTATPSANITLTELNGEGEATEEDLRCFIATATYGTPLHKNLRPLRWFRDGIARLHPAGSELVETYYRLSPPAAEWISRHPMAAKLVAAALWVPVTSLELAMTGARITGLNASTAVATMLAGLAMVTAVFGGTVMRLRRSRQSLGGTRA